jgi:hypothetical protein
MRRILALAIAAATVACSAVSDDTETGTEAVNAVDDPKELFDVNDISILFARGERGEVVPNIPVSEPVRARLLDGTVRNEEIWSQAAFDDVIKYAKRTGKADPQLTLDVGADDRKNWRIVGVRFSPCGPGSKALNPDRDTKARMATLGVPGCLVQIRLVAQPFSVGPNGIADEDVAAHLVYSIGPATNAFSATDPILEAARAQAKKMPEPAQSKLLAQIEQLVIPEAIQAKVRGAQDAMLADLRAIKKASAEAGAPTTGATLGVHPGLKAHADRKTEKTQKVADLTRDFVTKWVGAASTIRTAAFMGLRAGSEPWVFLSGKISRDQSGETRWGDPDPADPNLRIAGPLPSFIDPRNPVQSLQTAPKHIRLSFSEDDAIIVGENTPLKPATPEELSAGRSNTVSLFSAQKPNATEAARIAFVGEKFDTHILNTDCVTCHTTSARISALGIRSTADRIRVPRGITGYVANDAFQGTKWNTRNFGFFRGKPTVSLRTVNETAEFAALLNMQAQANKPEAERLQGPARDCTKNDDQVFNCLVHGDCGPNPEELRSLKACGKLVSE